MEYDEIKEKAKKKVEEKKGFYVIAMIFGAVSVILLVLSTFFSYPTAFWIQFPVLVLGLVLAVLYFSIFGIPGSKVLTQEWEAAETAKEINRLYRKHRSTLPPDQELSEEDKLELKTLEKLKQKWEDADEYV